MNKTYIIDYPDLLKEWHFEKNAEHPESISHASGKKVWWRCRFEHEWQASVANRVKGTGCPFCDGRRVQPGINDLQTLRPSLAEEWHPLKNAPLTPGEVVIRSNKKVWWICAKGHEWQGTIANRTAGHHCPYCSGRRADQTHNLAAENPLLASEWNYEKNDGLTPEEIRPHSSKSVWWRCREGHEWKAVVSSRRKSGCPYCGGKKVLPGYNDLKSVDPILAGEWHPTRNLPLLPSEITPHSNKKVWWQCGKGHEWKALVNSRSSGNGCPFCSNQRVCTDNALAATNPKLAAEWHPSKNGFLTPEMVVAGSNRNVWWQCVKGHSWKTSVVTRSNGSECPQCSKVLKTSFPEQAVFFYLQQLLPAQSRAIVYGRELDVYLPSLNVGIEYDGSYFHQDENRDRKKTAYFEKHGVCVVRIKESNGYRFDRKEKILYCKPDKQYSYIKEVMCELTDWISRNFQLALSCKVDIERDRAAILERYKTNREENSLMAKCPDITAFWHREKNGNLTAADVSFCSTIRIWLRCKLGHEWQASPQAFQQKHRCPFCSGQRVLKGFNDLATKK